MTDFAQLLDHLDVTGPLPSGPTSMPLGTAWLAESGRGVDLSAYGYVEEEYLVHGQADGWTWDERLRATATGPLPYTTRILLRRPTDPARFSGTVHIEAHHPDGDRALSWAMLAPWIVRSGHAHIGVTQEPAVIPDLQWWDAARYAPLSIPDPTQRYDIVAQVAAAARAGRTAAFADLSCRAVVLSGWSMTGTFARTFIGEGFHGRCQTDGVPAFSGYVICISSGGAGRAGYASLRDATVLPMDDPRRTIRVPGVPVIELLSEGEAETHRSVTRPDSDDPDDPYRLYEVAGTSHIATGIPAVATNGPQMEARGASPQPRHIEEQPSDAGMDLVARAVFAALERWIAAGEAPPRAERFDYAPPGSGLTKGLMAETEPLARDADGNVVGGVRTAWVDVPTGAYLPHSTPRPGSCLPAPHAPYAEPAMVADLIGHIDPWPADELRRRYATPEAFAAMFARRSAEMVAAGWLLADDVAELNARAEARFARGCSALR